MRKPQPTGSSLRRRAGAAALFAPERLESRTLLAGNAGDLDPTFSGDGVAVQANAGFDRDGRDIAKAPNGKFVTIENETVTDPDNYSSFTRIARYNANGTRDTTFGSGGVATVNGATHVAVRGDGKVLVGGNAFVVRLNANGSRDTSFSGDGRADLPSDFVLRGLAAAPGDKVVGAFHGSGDLRRVQFEAFRLNANGSPDTTFSGDGFAAIRYSTNVNDVADEEDVVVRADGRVVVVGSVYNRDNEFYVAGRFAVAQFTAGGTGDHTFGSGGLVLTEFAGGAEAFAESAALAPGGKLVVGGVAYAGDAQRVALARYNANGSRDATFSGDGMHTLDVGLRPDPADVVVQGDGKILVAGDSIFDGYEYSSNREFFAARLTSGGGLDATWDGDGLAVTDFFRDRDEAYAAALDSSGRLLVVGEIRVDQSSLVNRGVARYTTAGRLDTTFSGDGRIGDDFPQTFRDGAANVVQPDGKVIVAGSWIGAGKPNGFKRDFYLTRYNANGSLDSTFGSGGRVWTDFGGRYDGATNLLLLPDGKIVAVGQSVSGSNPGEPANVAVARYNPNGSLDTSFDGDGKLLRDLGGYDYAADLARDASGDLLVSAMSVTSTSRQSVLMRLNPNGSLDPGLDGNGLLYHDYGTEMALQQDGKIVLATKEQNDQFIDGGTVVTRLHPSGLLDTSFDCDGRTPVIGLGPEDDLTPVDLRVTAGGKILVLADASIDSRASYSAVSLIRLDGDGSFDETFGGGGDGRTLDRPFDFAYFERPSAVAVDSKGRIVVTGATEPYDAEFGDSNRQFLIRYSPDGVLESGFGGGAATHGRSYTRAAGGVDVAVGPGDKPVTVGGRGIIVSRFLAEPTTTGGETVSLRAAADAYVRDGTFADANYGAATRLEVKRSGTSYSRESYLRFNLSGVGSVGSAKLRLFARLDNTLAADAGFTVYSSADTSWSETAVTWNTRPAAGTTAHASGVVAGTTAKWYEVDLTAFLKAQKAAGATAVTLVLKPTTTSGSTIVIESDEGANRPELVVTA